MRCQRCGHDNPDTAKFCAECGASLRAAESAASAARQERKVVSVLFADLVGFTSRAERLDPEDVHALLAPYHAHVKGELERYGGTVEKFIGDAVMALFGATVAHEDDPERAVRAALAIRDWAEGEADLHIRIGVTTGEALVSLDARPEAGEGMASGDVVNTAARLQAAAPAGAILVDETTYRATSRVIGYATAEAIEAKGKAEPIPVWRPVEALSRLGVDVRQHGGAPLVGRARELQLLIGSLDRVRERREPELVTLIGVPGIGKSRLVYELLRHVDREPDLTMWRQGRSLPYGEGVTFWALGEMIKAQAGILETDGAAEATTKLELTTRAVIADPSDADRTLRHLRPLVGLATDAELARDRNEVFTAWRGFFEALAGDRPLVLVFEDLHWADDSLLDFVDHLVDWSSGSPILVLATARPELMSRRAGWGGGKANATTLSLHPLTEDETSALVRSLLDRAVTPTDVQHEVLARAEGNPLYAEEFARMIAERVGRAAGAGDEMLPESVQGIIAARLDALPAAEKALLQSAAVIGKVFWRGSVERLGNVDGARLDERLHALQRKEFIRREPRSSVSGETEYAFRHVLVRDVAYGQIPRAARAEKHRLAAEWLESLGAERTDDRADMRAHHYGSALELASAAGGATDDLIAGARRALRDAGDRALSLHAPTAAAGFYDRALALLPADDPDRADMLYRRATAHYVGYTEESISYAEEARDALIAAGDTSRGAHAEQMVSRLWWYRGRSDLAREHMARAVEILGDDRHSEQAVRVLANAARLLTLERRHEEALQLTRQVAPIADALGLAIMRANIATTSGMARVDLGDPGGFEDLERAVEIALAAGELTEAAIGAQNLGAHLWVAGEVARGWEIAMRAMEYLQKSGASASAAFQEAVISQNHFHAGTWDEGMVEWQRIIDAGRAATMEPALLKWVALVQVARGEDDAARASADRMVNLARLRTEVLSEALAAAARVHVEVGDPERARAHVAEALARDDVEIEALLHLAFTARDLGFTQQVSHALGRFIERSRQARASMALVDGRYDDAVADYDHMGLRPEAAEVRLRAGRKLVDEGKPEEAEERLRPAIEFFGEVRAGRYLAQAEGLLAQARATPSGQPAPIDPG